ncbi:MAG: ABC transporter ATP-binding protein [Planctomycetota bacterium]
MAGILFKDLSKSFGTVKAVSSLTLAVEDGEFFVLLGPSGAGKSTLLSLLTGMLRPDSGSVEIDGRLVSSDSLLVPPRERGISAVFQEGGLWPHMTVLDHLSFVLKGRLSSSAALERAKRYLDMVRLSDKLHRYPHELSGGERQRLALARSLCVENKVLLLDEPFANLDRPLVLELIADVVELHRTLKLTTVLVTHQQEDALFVADRMAVMKDGAIVQCSEPRELYFRPADRFVAGFFGDNNVLAAEAVNGEASTPLGTMKTQAKDGPLWLCVRPSAIRAERSGDGVTAILVNSLFKGEFWLGRLKIASGETVLVNFGLEPPEPGEWKLKVTGPAILLPR